MSANESNSKNEHTPDNAVNNHIRAPNTCLVPFLVDDRRLRNCYNMSLLKAHPELQALAPKLKNRDVGLQVPNENGGDCDICGTRTGQPNDNNILNRQGLP